MITDTTNSAESEKAIDDFGHVADVMLRSVLQAKPRHVRAAAIRQALDRTLDALGHDLIRDDVPMLALKERIEAAREAAGEMERGRLAPCHRALRRVWSI